MFIDYVFLSNVPHTRLYSPAWLCMTHYEILSLLRFHFAIIRAVGLCLRVVRMCFLFFLMRNETQRNCLDPTGNSKYCHKNAFICISIAFLLALVLVIILSLAFCTNATLYKCKFSYFTFHMLAQIVTAVLSIKQLCLAFFLLAQPLKDLLLNVLLLVQSH